MKLSRLLALAALGTAAAYFLQSKRGKELRSELSDRAGEWSKKLRSYSEEALEDGQELTGKAKKQVADYVG